MLPTIQVGPAAIPTRPLLMLLAYFVCLTWAERRMPRHGLPADLAFNTGYLFGAVTVVGGRLWYAATYWAVYASNPGDLFSTNTNSIAYLEGAAIGLLATIAYLRFKRVSLAAFGDAFTPGLLSAFALGSLGALASGNAYGAPSDVPWAISLADTKRHPSQVYELLVALVALAFVVRMPPLPSGSLFFRALALYGTGRVFIEAFRGDSLLIADGIRVMQVIWLGGALVGLALLARMAPAARTTP